MRLLFFVFFRSVFPLCYAYFFGGFFICFFVFFSFAGDLMTGTFENVKKKPWKKNKKKTGKKRQKMVCFCLLLVLLLVLFFKFILFVPSFHRSCL